MAAAVGLLVALLTARLVWIQVLHPDDLIRAGNARVVRNYHYEPPRGLITDRNGRILAISVPVKTVTADPKRMQERGLWRDETGLARLAQLLDLAPAELKSRLGNDPTRRFAQLRTDVSLKRAAAVTAAFGKRGVQVRDSYRRTYPTGEVAAPLVGLLNREGGGVYGVEQSFNDFLSARPEVTAGRKDRYDRVVENLGEVSAGAAGGNLMLSIDSRLQSAAYEALGAQILRHKADGGSAVVLDVNTGEILAMVSYPSFDPNDRREFDSARAKNRAISDMFEPGSTMKPVVALAALEQHALSWQEVFDTRPFVVDGKTVRDSHFMERGTLKEIIQFSSNTGMARIALRIGPQKITEVFGRLGFGNKTGSGLVGESGGRLVGQRKFWSEIDKATLGFGYGVAVTALQLASAYATLADGGGHRPVSVLRVRQAPPRQQVLNEGAVRQVQRTMESVVTAGTGRSAAIGRYKVAGKTGTAKIAGAGGYSDLNTATFAGFAPLTAPRFAAVVVINAPRENGVGGGAVSAPVFSEIMTRALRLYNVPPDRGLQERN